MPIGTVVNENIEGNVTFSRAGLNLLALSPGSWKTCLWTGIKKCALSPKEML